MTHSTPTGFEAFDLGPGPLKRDFTNFQDAVLFVKELNQNKKVVGGLLNFKIDGAWRFRVMWFEQRGNDGARFESWHLPGARLS